MMVTSMRAMATPKSKRRYGELLEAARLTFERLGYHDTRVADIVQAAGVSNGTFYTYFDSKVDVLKVLFSQVADDFYDALTVDVDRQATPLLTLEATIRQFMHNYRDRIPMIRIMEQAVSSSDEFIEDCLRIRARFSARLIATLETHPLKNAAGHPVDAEMVAYALGGMVDDFARGCYLLGHVVDEDAAISTMALIWASALGFANTEAKAEPRPAKRWVTLWT
jgi:AcrR family transcriptional regulator